MINDPHSQICFVHCGFEGIDCACYRRMMEELDMPNQPPIVKQFVSNRDRAITCIANTLMRITKPNPMNETVAQIYGERIIEDLEAKDWAKSETEVYEALEEAITFTNAANRQIVGEDLPDTERWMEVLTKARGES